MPTKPEKYITISNKFKVYFYPIVFTVIVVLLFIASIISLPNDLGSVIVGLYILLFVLCVVLPAYCIIYAKRVLTKEKHGFADFKSKNRVHLSTRFFLNNYCIFVARYSF